MTGHWNGEPAECRRVRVVVEGTPKPLYWWRDLVGTERDAVLVRYHDQTHLLDDEDGSGWAKVTEGHGSPRRGHRDLPLTSRILGDRTPATTVPHPRPEPSRPTTPIGAGRAAPTIGVCGFGRCGSTMLMAMLTAGGVRAVDGTSTHSGELPDLAAIANLTADQLAGRAVKLLDWTLRAPLPPAPAWSFVWIDRDRVQQARSTVKFLHAIGALRRPNDDAPDGAHERWASDVRRTILTLDASYRRDRPRALAALRSAGPVVVLNYEQVLANPRRAVRHLRRIAPNLDGPAAVAAVHQRDGKCRPDLTFEASHG